MCGGSVGKVFDKIVDATPIGAAYRYGVQKPREAKADARARSASLEAETTRIQDAEEKKRKQRKATTTIFTRGVPQLETDAGQLGG